MFIISSAILRKLICNSYERQHSRVNHIHRVEWMNCLHIEFLTFSQRCVVFDFQLAHFACYFVDASTIFFLSQGETKRCQYKQLLFCHLVRAICWCHQHKFNQRIDKFIFTLFFFQFFIKNKQNVAIKLDTKCTRLLTNDVSFEKWRDSVK